MIPTETGPKMHNQFENEPKAQFNQVIINFGEKVDQNCNDRHMPSRHKFLQMLHRTKNVYRTENN